MTGTPGGHGPIPVVPAGTLLRLGGDDWSYGLGLSPGSQVELVVVWVREDLAHLHDDALWVHGHTPECGYDPDPHPPCRELLVTRAALTQAARSHDR